MHGHLSEDLFQKSYSFLTDYKKSEVEMTKEQVRKEKDPEVREQLLQMMSTQMQSLNQEQKEQERKAFKSARLKKEREAVKNGKKPFYPKKGELFPPFASFVARKS